MDFFPNEEEYDSDKYHKCKCLYQIHFLLHVFTYKQELTTVSSLSVEFVLKNKLKGKNHWEEK